MENLLSSRPEKTGETRHWSIFPNRCKVVFAEEKSKADLSIYFSNYILIIQKLEKVFLSENLFCCWARK